MKNKKTAPKHTGAKKRGKGLLIALLILIILAIAFAGLVMWKYDVIRDFVLPGGNAEPPVEDVVETTPEPVVHSIRFHVASDDDKSFHIDVEDGGSFEMPEGTQIDGYTFLCWLNSDGEKETRKSITPDGDMDFYARYAVAFKNEAALERHEPYMHLDGDGYFHPNGRVTRGEVVQTLFDHLELSGIGSEFFLDLTEEDELYPAAATLKTLGIIDGVRVHASDEVTIAEFYSMLVNLFPEHNANFLFTNVPVGSDYYDAFCLAMEKGWLTNEDADPYDFLTRKDFARIINSLTGRTGMEHEDAMLVGTIMDVVVADPYYADIAEAIIPHSLTVEDGVERWTESDPVDRKDPGFFFIGTDAHFVKDDGAVAVNEQVGSFMFDENGIVTTGNAELDTLVRAKLAELIDPNTQTREEMLRKIYDWATYDTSYLGGSKHDFGETGWEVDEAYRMLSTGKGNCYAYAASFWALSRAIGYDTVCYSGTVGTHGNPHGWAEIVIDGTPYIFDPTLEYEEWYGPGEHTFERFFMKPYASVTGWNYTRG